MSIRWNPGTGRHPRIVVGAMVHIPKQLVDCDAIRADLTVKNDVYWQTLGIGGDVTGVEPVYELWTETDEMISVPRAYWRTMVGLNVWRGVESRDAARAVLSALDHTRTAPRVEPIRHQITLRDEVQRQASRALIEDTKDKIISLACGKGKTVVSLHAASEGARFPLLIVVHTNALKDQWRENYDDHGTLIGGIKKFYGLRDEEIGHIQGPKSEWRGYKVAIAMLHTLVLKDFDFDFYRYWRLVIFDEVHRLGAGFFMKAAGMFAGERWGLSATVDREDRMDRVFRVHLGDVVYESLDQPLKPEVLFLNTGLSVDMGKFMLRGGRCNLAKLQTYLSEHPRRNEVILRYIRRAYKQGRTVLVLGERLSQLHEMAERLSAEGLDAGVYVGSTKKQDRRAALRRRVIFATQQIAKEGLDKSNLDTLFILIPFGGKGRLQQSLGRILRIHATKQAPVAMIFEDDISIIMSLARKMRRFIRGFGYTPKELQYREKGEG